MYITRNIFGNAIDGVILINSFKISIVLTKDIIIGAVNFRFTAIVYDKGDDRVETIRTEKYTFDIENINLII